MENLQKVEKKLQNQRKSIDKINFSARTTTKTLMEFWSINFPFFAFTNIIRKSVWILFSNDFKGWQNTATNFDLGTDKYELFFKE